MKQLTEINSWQQLQQLAEAQRAAGRSFFSRTDRIKTQNCITLDYSRQRVNDAIIDSLIDLAEELKLADKIDSLMSGGRVNISENKAALHTALRHFDPSPILIDGLNIMDGVYDTRERIKWVAEAVRSKKWLGYSGKPITDIVNIGIGGSDLGPRLCINALKDYTTRDLSYHFISDVDADSFQDVLQIINPQTTLFIVTSKSFTTKETLFNFYKVLELYTAEQPIEKHVIAVTAYPERAQKLGIKTILPIWDWVGGRYSFCSAVNLITAIAVGYDHFSALLAGANDIDQHLRHTDFKNNIPVLMALFGIWNNNFLNHHSVLLLAYAKRLEYFIPYLQQLDMESNGKSLDVTGKAVHYATGPIIWGGLGNQAQHSYMQLLAQGTHRCAAEFISLRTNDQQLINSMCDYKMKVLSEGIESIENPNGYIPGNMPINHLILSECSPFSLGALVALYEHKVFIQSVIWNINPFDQPGVESAKLMNASTVIELIS